MLDLSSLSERLTYQDESSVSIILLLQVTVKTGRSSECKAGTLYQGIQEMGSNLGSPICYGIWANVFSNTGLVFPV